MRDEHSFGFRALGGNTLSMRISISKMLQHNATSHLYTPNSVFSTLGIVGPSQDHSAMERWALTAHFSISVSCNLKDLCGININFDEKELSSKTIEEQKSCPTPCFKIHAVEKPFAFNGDSKRKLHNIATGSIGT